MNGDAVHSVRWYQGTQRLLATVGAGALLCWTVAFSGLIVTRGATLSLLLIVACAGSIAAGMVWRQPVLAVYILIFAALFVDQWPVVGIEPFTQELRFFQTISAFTPVPLPMMPADILLLFALAIVLLPGLVGYGPGVRGGPLAAPVLVFFLAVVGALAYGYAIGRPGTTFYVNAAWAEARGFVQFVLAYFVAASLLRSRERLTTYFWVLIVALGLKGVQGLHSFYVERRGGLHLEAITGHEDVVFFATFFLFLAGLVLFGGHARQRQVMLYFLPAVAFTELATGRRIAFFVLALGALLIGFCLYKVKRQLFMRLAPAVAVLLVVYTAVFWNFNNNPLGQPVRAFKSQFSEASERDRRSDVWRDLENINLGMNIQHAPITGLGFGRPYNFYIEIPSLESTGFVYWIYMNHNAIFWVWMKMGILGFTAFWYVLGSAVMYGLLAFRKTGDGYLKSAAIVGVSLVLMQIFFSYGDLGLTYSRCMIYMGLMVGMLARLPEIAAEPAAPLPAATMTPAVARAPAIQRKRWFAVTAPAARQ